MGVDLRAELAHLLSVFSPRFNSLGALDVEEALEGFSTRTYVIGVSAPLIGHLGEPAIFHLRASPLLHECFGGLLLDLTQLMIVS